MSREIPDAANAGLSRLRQHESSLLAAIVRTTDDAVIVQTSDGSIANWNHGAESMFGFSEREVLRQAMRISDLIVKGEKRRYRQYIRQLLDGSEVHRLETRMKTRTGQRLDIWITASVLRDAEGKVTGVAIILRDITEKNAIEERLEALLESTPDPFVIVGADGSIQRVNRQAEKLFEYSRSEMLGKSYKVLIPERFREQHDRFTELYLKKPAMRKMGGDLQLWCLSGSGQEIPVEIGLSPVGDKGGHSVMVRFRDTRTERFKQEQLTRATRKANEANRVKTRFLAAASHDLRQPLQSISMYLGVLEGNISPEERHRIIGRSRMALDSTSELLNALLNITKLESGKVQPEIGTFAINTLLERVYNTGSQQATGKAQTFRMMKTSLAVISDPALLEQLVANLVANALKYTQPQGHIVLGCRRKKHHVMVTVADNGPGIPPDELDMIFDEYRQLEHEGGYLGRGMGLGLSIVKLIAELLDLKLEVKSTPGKGSSFSVLVPRSEAKALPVSEPATASPRQLRFAGTLLLIDDDPAVLDSTRLFLEVSGLTVITAQSPEEALQTLSIQTPDIIVTDYALSEQENGIELVERIRQSCNRSLPAIVVTGDSSDMRLQEAKASGCELLSKPIEAHVLLQLALRQLGCE